MRMDIERIVRAGMFWGWMAVVAIFAFIQTAGTGAILVPIGLVLVVGAVSHRAAYGEWVPFSDAEPVEPEATPAE